ncbi:MAG: LacI family DNA-binding transcriptional regulator [Fimbriimonadaceae bacterium]
MRVTQRDIARYARVSQATVSRVLAGDRRVEPELRSKVMEAISRHNYRPDARARSLRTQASNLIGLAIQRPQGGLNGDPFFTSLISEILDMLVHTEYHLCLETVPAGRSQGAVYDELLRSRRVDGLILVESEANDERLDRLQRDQFPFVLIGNPLSACVWSVDNDNVYAGEVATRHLFENGYRRVGFLAGRPGITVSEDRLAGYQRVTAEHGAPCRVWNAEFGFEAARETAVRALSGSDAPDALVVLDDFMAMGVVLAARELRLHIPDDLGLVSFNDTNVCQFLACGLTSVSLNIPEIVKSAVGTLLAIMEGKQAETPQRHIVPCVLRVRGSSLRSGRGTWI